MRHANPLTFPPGNLPICQHIERLLAGIVLSHCDTQRDFVGHVGGDDFIVLFQSSDWRLRCEAIIAELAARARQMFDEEARRRCGIEAEDRHGVMRFFPCTTLSIGAVMVQSGALLRAEDVATRAALAKHHAKSDPNGLCVLDALQAAQPNAVAMSVAG